MPLAEGAHELLELSSALDFEKRFVSVADLDVKMFYQWARTWVVSVQTLLCRTFYSIDPTEGLSEILYADEANGKDTNFPQTAPLTPSLMGSNSGSYPIC